MKPTRPGASDYLWVFLAAAAGIAALLAVVGFVNALAALGSTDLGMWHRIAPPLFAVGYLAALVWIAGGAWRRTVWGCRVATTSHGTCPRHGSRCIQSRQDAATVGR